MCQRLCVGVDGVGFLIPFRVEVSLSSAHLVRFDQADINRLGDQDTSYYIMLHLQEKKAGSLKRSRSLLDLYRGVYVIICVIICCIIICYIICFFSFFSLCLALHGVLFPRLAPPCFATRELLPRLLKEMPLSRKRSLQFEHV